MYTYYIERDPGHPKTAQAIRDSVNVGTNNLLYRVCKIDEQNNVHVVDDRLPLVNAMEVLDELTR